MKTAQFCYGLQNYQIPDLYKRISPSNVLCCAGQWINLYWTIEIEVQTGSANDSVNGVGKSQSHCCKMDIIDCKVHDTYGKYCYALLQLYINLQHVARKIRLNLLSCTCSAQPLGPSQQSWLQRIFLQTSALAVHIQAHPCRATVCSDTEWPSFHSVVL